MATLCIRLEKLQVILNDGYYINVMKQSAGLAVDPITVDHFALLFNCTPVGQGYYMMVPT